MKRIVFAIFFVLINKIIIAQNPISPPGVYIADPSAHQWKDGKMYIYGSRDEDPKYYCSGSYDVLSSSDLQNWELSNNTFAAYGPNDQVAYSDHFLYAPDCQYRKGVYYLYYCLASNKSTEGVATSNSPDGPFVKGKNIPLKGINEIDPCVFIDDNGQGYYLWGQFTAKIAKLKPNMIEIDTTTIRDNLVTEKEHFFHEGGYMVKRKGIYYFVYAHMGRAGRPTCLGYATSRSPMGPFKYQGVIIDNDHCDPKNWNNHGSIAAFNGKWYVFYHRSTHGSETMRKACAEPITFNDDGTIYEVEMTTQGVGGPLKATDTLGAARACLLYGNVRIQAFAPDNEELGGIKNGDAAAYKYINFEDSISTFTARVAPGANPSSIEIGIDNFWGRSIGKLEIPGNEDGNTWKILSCKVKVQKGVRALWLRFTGSGDNLLRFDYFYFN